LWRCTLCTDAWSRHFYTIQSLPTLAHCPREKRRKEGRRERREERKGGKGEEEGRREGQEEDEEI